MGCGEKAAVLINFAAGVSAACVWLRDPDGLADAAGSAIGTAREVSAVRQATRAKPKNVKKDKRYMAG